MDWEYVKRYTKDGAKEAQEYILIIQNKQLRYQISVLVKKIHEQQETIEKLKREKLTRLLIKID